MMLRFSSARVIQVAAGLNCRRIKPKYRKSQLRIGCFDKGPGDTGAALHGLRSAVDEIAQDSTVIIEFYECDNVGFSTFPFRLGGPPHD